MSSSNEPTSADTQHLNQPTICQPPKRIPRPKTCKDGIKLYFKLMYERRNMVKMPPISTASFPLFLRSLLACLFYIVTFRQTAWYRLSVELLQQRVEATLPLLKATVQSAACSENFSETTMKTQLSLLGTRSNEEYYVDEWNVIEFTSLHEHWNLFHSYKATLWNRPDMTLFIGVTTCVSSPHRCALCIKLRMDSGFVMEAYSQWTDPKIPNQSCSASSPWESIT